MKIIIKHALLMILGALAVATATTVLLSFVNTLPTTLGIFLLVVGQVCIVMVGITGVMYFIKKDIK